MFTPPGDGERYHELPHLIRIIYNVKILTIVDDKYDKLLLEWCKKLTQKFNSTDLYLKQSKNTIDKLLECVKIKILDISHIVIHNVKSVEDSIQDLYDLEGYKTTIWEQHIIHEIDKTVEIVQMYENLHEACMNYEASKLKTLDDIRKIIPYNYHNVPSELNYLFNESILTSILTEYYFDPFVYDN